ncbi:MAG: diguanylate cyclase [Zoogloeaceae bacterium]|jgi:diguanylate cyclase (GGDEF)-like protein|nr:diguanylate cyclase [Zoogloeaceae bacterium]
MLTTSSLLQKERALQLAWIRYQAYPNFEHFVEFSLSINNCTDTLSQQSQTGLHHACRQLEQQALTLFGNENSHPIAEDIMRTLGEQVARLSGLLRHYCANEGEVTEERRARQEPDTASSTVRILNSAQQVFLMGEHSVRQHDLATQLGYFGISVCEDGWELPAPNHSGLGVYLLDVGEQPATRWIPILQQLRERVPLAHIVCLGMPNEFVAINQVLQAGADHCMAQNASLQQILSQVLAHGEIEEQESYRVLIIEDSRTAAHVINRALEERGTLTQVLYDPLQTLAVIRQFQPDLILMDMYMPSCTGVEVARVIRQYDEFLSIPIVYLSSETNIGLQVEALRLGGDQFLTKPFNPVLVNAVVKSKIDRYRALRHSMQNDSLTDLLNHISSQQALAAALERLRDGEGMAVAMLDIDHFKRVNDTHGHPVGDQVIRSLAWLLKQRLRRSDIIGRYGGEEFVVGLARARANDAEEILDRIRNDFSRIVFYGADNSPFRTSFSVGVAVCAEGAPMKKSLNILLEAADSALYQAKRQGRNRVVLTRR